MKNQQLYYIFHKRTENRGGSQDYERAEITHNLQNSIGLSKKTGIFLIVLDGNNYDNNIISYFKSINQDVIIMNINQCIDFFKNNDNEEKYES